jgi:Phosphotransferase enzyme family
MQSSWAIADLLLAKNGGGSCNHASFALPSGAMLITPQRGRVRRGGLALYNPQRIPGLAVKGFIWTGLWRGKTVELSAEALDDLCKTLAVVLGEPHVECAFHFGCPGIYSKLSKTVIVVMDRAGRPLAYAKLAAFATARAALMNEASVLERLSAVTALRDRVPRVLGRTEWRGLSLLLVSPGSSRRAPKRFGPMHHDFLASLASATRAPGAFIGSPTWRVMIRSLEAWRSQLPPQWRDRYDSALFELERRFGSTQLDLVLAHRDFVSSNTRLSSDGTLFVFDWEYSRPASLPGCDFFHFHVRRARNLDPDQVGKLISAARSEKVEPADDLLLAYLVDVALSFHDDLLTTGEEIGRDYRFLEMVAQGIDVLRSKRDSGAFRSMTADVVGRQIKTKSRVR